MRDEQPTKNCAFFGEGVRFSGSVAAENKITVNGTGEGDIAALELLVSSSGTIKGHVRVERADIYGKALAKIEALDCLLLRKSGRIEGSVSYGDIEIERGGIISGELRTSKPTDEVAIPSLIFQERAAG